ncbi:putative ABC transporter ATP-binding protein [Actinokineospora sp. UTMC 2448]|nr:putative ABC transporter ATP-binding protein [Actinokineospora sp. UTMC 2448]
MAGGAGAGDRVLLGVVERGAAAVLVVVALGGTVAALVLPAALADAVNGGGVVAVAVAGVGVLVAEVLGLLVSARVTARTGARLRGDVAAHLIRLGPGRFADGDAIGRLTSDCAGAAQVTALAVQLVSGALVSVGAVVLLAVVDWRVAVVFLVALPLALMIARSHLRITAADVAAYQSVTGELGARLLDAVRGIRTIAAAGVADQEAERVLRPLPSLSKAGAAIWRGQARMVWRGGLLRPAVQVAVLVAAGFGLMAGRLAIGDVLAVLGYATLGMGVVGQVSALTGLARSRACAARIAEVVDTPLPPTPELPLPDGPGTVTLKDVSHGELSSVDLTIPGGTSVAVVGPGARDLAAVLAGITPDAGTVLLDGVPIADLRDRRTAVGVAFARPVLLGATVTDAVAYGVPQPTDVRAACEAARIAHLIDRLPSGYATPMADTPLSGGEAQRVGLARAITAHPRLLVLDEATAALDTVTESEVDEAIAALLPTATRITVTTRAGTASRADLVLWLADGKARALAPHATLWSNPEYREVFT